MARAFEATDWREYRMDMRDPHHELEPLEDEVAVVDAALAELVEAGVLPHGRYDGEKFLAHRAAVKWNFDIPWTGISPRMQRLLYAINAVARPATFVGVGIFCGNTFISNAGAAVGPGACYEAERLVGIEIKPEEADRARRNVATLDPDGKAEIVAAEGVEWVRGLEGAIDLLYLDADGAGGRGKAIYLDIIEAARHAFRPGTLVLAHNSVNSAARLAAYLDHVRDAANFRESVNAIVDDQGLEVSIV
jgi:predicted O-methyltransferase YrrM